MTCTTKTAWAIGYIKKSDIHYKKMKTCPIKTVSFIFSIPQ